MAKIMRNGTCYGSDEASDIKFNDSKSAETKVGAINGITSDINCEDETIAASAAMVNQLKNTTTPKLLWSGTATDGSSATLNESIENFNWIVLIAKNNLKQIYSIPVLALALQGTDSSYFLTHCLPQDNSISVYKSYTKNTLSFWMTSKITLKKIYGC